MKIRSFFRMKNGFNRRRIIIILRLNSTKLIFVWVILTNKNRVDTLLLICIWSHNFQYNWFSFRILFIFFFFLEIFTIWMTLKYFIRLYEWRVILQTLFSHHHYLMFTRSHVFLVLKLVLNNCLLHYWNLLWTYWISFLWK